LPPLYCDGTRLSYTDTIRYLSMECDKNINMTTVADAALRPFTAGTFRVKKFVRDNVLTNRLHAHIWLLKTYAFPASMYVSQIWSTPIFKQGKEMDNPVQKWLLTVLNCASHRYARVWPWAPRVQLVSCHNACLQFFDPMQQHYCQTGFTCWHATELQVWWLLVFPYCFSHDWSGTDMQLSSLSLECWSSHILSAMEG